MKRNVIIGLVISALFVYLAMRGIDFSELAASLKSAHYAGFIPVLLAVLLAHCLRSYRWGIILKSLVAYDRIKLFMLFSIGFMAVGLLPARLGEFARPYLVKQQSGIKMSATMATIIVERVFDMLSLMLVLFTVVLQIALPPLVFKAGLVLLSVTFCLFLLLIFMAVKKDFSLQKIDLVVSKLPSRLAKPLNRLAHSFVEGLQILPDVKKTLFVALLSIMIWTCLCLSVYFLFSAFDFSLPIINAFAISVIIALGVMLPAAPGFVGTYHYACTLGLTSFGIAKPEALSFAIVLHFLQWGPPILLGLAFLPFHNISLPGIIHEEEEAVKQEGLEK